MKKAKEDLQYPKRKLLEIGSFWCLWIAIMLVVSVVSGEGFSPAFHTTTLAIVHMIGVLSGYRHAVGRLTNKAD